MLAKSPEHNINLLKERVTYRVRRPVKRKIHLYSSGRFATLSPYA